MMAVVGEARVHQRAAMPEQLHDLTAGRGLPYPCGLVEPGGDEPAAVGTERDAADLALVPTKLGDDLPRVNLEHAGCAAVVAIRGRYAVPGGAPGDAHDLARELGSRKQEALGLGRMEIPDGHGP